MRLRADLCMPIGTHSPSRSPGLSHWSTPAASSCSRQHLCASSKHAIVSAGLERGAGEPETVRFAADVPLDVAVVEADEVALRARVEQRDGATVPVCGTLQLHPPARMAIACSRAIAGGGGLAPSHVRQPCNERFRAAPGRHRFSDTTDPLKGGPDARDEAAA